MTTNKGDIMFEESASELYKSLSGEKKLLVSILKSAVDDKDFDYLQSEGFDTVCFALGVPIEDTRRMAIKAAKLGKKTKFKS